MGCIILPIVLPKAHGDLPPDAPREYADLPKDLSKGSHVRQADLPKDLSLGSRDCRIGDGDLPTDIPTNIPKWQGCPRI